MKIWKTITVLICLFVSLMSCIQRRKKSNTTQIFHRTGEAIAIDKLIQQFENEHQKLYKGQHTESSYLEWPILDNKDLSKYCREYLQQIVPSRRNVGATGIKMREILNYKLENTRMTSVIVIVQCKTWYKTHAKSYYMTQALDPNCVYALKSSGDRRNIIFNIIHKYCNFEDKPLIDRSLKQKKERIIDRKNQTTGQPIAKDKYLLKYELEHLEMIKKSEGECFQWLHALEHENLNLYCYQYMRECCPDRRREGVTGSWNTLKLHYQKLNVDKDIFVTTITCHQHYASQKRQYHSIKAPEMNCVYAVLRKGNHVCYPLVIIYKHCNFEDALNSS